ncbi:MAG: aspartyl/glutamyl-tRNA(Asn/Gln) amidotransferase subunit, partial [Anaerocolumna sp.]|nr:aspartyl/glutamyl-tRNA(Asn/Gln) amidotransferase subunit [Anaerocolumna sp.]
MDITKLTALELGKKIKNKEVSVIDATKALLEKIKISDENYNCYITIMEQEALARASEVQKQIDAGEL